MIFDAKHTPRDQAQELMWDAMDLIGQDDERAAELCHRALSIYPDCVDALAMLADLECDRVKDHVDAMRKAVAAGRRDLGPKYFKSERGHFWGLIETRPFMRAMAQLAHSLMEWATDECVDEAIEIQEEMLDLNPNDNQGVRDLLVACYLQRKHYNEAAELLKRYEDDWMAVSCWARVLLAHAAGDDDRAEEMLAQAREQNPHVELYLTGQKRRPRTRTDYYSPGEETEAVFCADTLWEAWKKHPKSKRWLKAIVAAG
jgi:tetratricopeptide (TPR) repeat protein